MDPPPHIVDLIPNLSYFYDFRSTCVQSTFSTVIMTMNIWFWCWSIAYEFLHKLLCVAKCERNNGTEKFDLLFEETFLRCFSWRGKPKLIASFSIKSDNFRTSRAARSFPTTKVTQRNKFTLQRALDTKFAAVSLRFFSFCCSRRIKSSVVRKLSIIMCAKSDR